MLTNVMKCDAEGCSARIEVRQSEMLQAEGWVRRHITDVYFSKGNRNPIEIDLDFCPLHVPGK